MISVLQEWISTTLGLGLTPGELSPGQVLARGIVVYLAGVILVRVGHRRFMGRHTPFDFILAIMLGALLARAINGSAPLPGTLVAGFGLVFLDRAFAVATFHSERLRRWVEGTASRLVEDGEPVEGAMRKSHLSRDDLVSALRREGNVSAMEDVAEAYLERSGEVSVVPLRRPSRTDGGTSAGTGP